MISMGLESLFLFLLTTYVEGGPSLSFRVEGGPFFWWFNAL